MVRIGRKEEEVVEDKVWKPEADILIFPSYLIVCRIWYSVVSAYVEVPRLVGASTFCLSFIPLQSCSAHAGICHELDRATMN
jgi:hypothetical protein